MDAAANFEELTVGIENTQTASTGPAKAKSGRMLFDRDSRDTVGEPFVEDARMTCRDVNVTYGDKQAIKDVSLDIGRNEVIAMIGPSGCGKSTFLRCLNRMNDTIDTCRVTGQITPGRHRCVRQRYRCGPAAGPSRHGLPETQPLPKIHL